MTATATPESISHRFAHRLTRTDRVDRAPRLGIEHEYSVWNGDDFVDFGALIERLPVGGRQLHPTDTKVYQCPSGLALLADGNVAEVASPPVPLAPASARRSQVGRRWATTN